MVENNQIAAVFTLVNNQPEFQEIWTKYYSQYPFRLVILEHIFEKELDGNVVERAVGDNGAYLEHRKVYHGEIFDHPWMCKLTSDVQIELLKKHKTVIYTDIDELIVPKECTLEQYCKANNEDVVRTHGFHLVERRHVVHDGLFNKPIVTRVPVKWVAGWHGGTPSGKVDGNLWLVHLHRMDYEIAKKHWFARQQVKWNEDAERRRQSWQNHFPTEQEFKQWFYTEKRGHVREPVPQWLVDKLQGIVF